MTLLAVTRQSRDGRNRIGTIGRCGVGSGSFGRCSGDCWPASHMVALAGVVASGREHAIRVRGRATTVIPEAATPGLPGESGPNRAPAGRRSRCLVGPCSAPVTPAPGGWPRAGPPLTPRASVPHEKGSGWEDEGDEHRTGGPGTNRTSLPLGCCSWGHERPAVAKAPAAGLGNPAALPGGLPLGPQGS